ncbi:MAG: DUF2442 domain-containing protein, partial [Actinomycetota bacterium]
RPSQVAGGEILGRLGPDTPVAASEIAAPGGAGADEALQRVTVDRKAGGDQLGHLDFDGVLDGEVFEPLKDPALFAQVSVDAIAGTIAWPNGVDLDPDVLHGDYEPASGGGPRVLKEYRLGLTG